MNRTFLRALLLTLVAACASSGTRVSIEEVSIRVAGFLEPAGVT